MIEHLEWHQHAFIDKNNIVINVSVFEEDAHDSDLLDQIKDIFKAEQTICCCTFGTANVGDSWTGTEFRPPKKFASWIWSSSIKNWVAPIPEPIDQDLSEWYEDTLSWVVD